MSWRDWFPLRWDYFTGGTNLTPTPENAPGEPPDLREIINDLAARPVIGTVDDDYTVEEGDELMTIEVDPAANGGAITVTLPAEFPVGWVAALRQTTAGVVTVEAGAGATLDHVATAADPVTLAEQWAMATIEVRATDAWIISGQLTAV